MCRWVIVALALWRIASRSLAAEVAPVATGEPPVPTAGWRIELLAEAPQVQHPAAITCAPDGRIFVAEDPMDITTERADVAEGRILCFHPDGRRTVFVDHIYAAFGMQYLDGQLFVLHNPFFSSWQDAGDYGTNRVDRIRNTNPNWHALGWNDHVPANFRLGLDGRFYVATGDKGFFGAEGTDGKRFDFFGGGIVRWRPDGTELEPFSTGVRNILDVGLDAEDNLFTYDNTDEHEWMGRLTHMVDGGFYGYPHQFIPRQTNTLWCFGDFGAGAATDVAISLDDALPPDWRGNLLLADFGKRNVLRVRITPYQASFAVVGPQGVVTNVATIQDVEPLFSQVPEDFRPVGISFSPDGRSLILGDWQHRDVKDPQARNGRLWKLTWTGTSAGTPLPHWYVPAASGKPFKASNRELFAGLQHPSKSVRHCAQRRLAERAASNAEITQQLLLLLEDGSSPSFPRIHALWALDAIARSATNAPPPAPISPAIQARIADPDAVVAGQAMRWAGESRDRASVAPLLAQLSQPDLGLRLRTIIALGRIGSLEGLDPLLATLPPQNDWIRFSTIKAIQRIAAANPRAWNRLVNSLQTGDASHANAVAAALSRIHELPLAEALIRASRTKPPSGATNDNRIIITELLTRVLRKPPAWDGGWWAYHPFRTPPPSATESWAGTTGVREALIALLSDADPSIRSIAAMGLLREDEAAVTSALASRFAVEQDPNAQAALLRGLARRRDPAIAQRVAEILQASQDQPILTSAAIDAAAQLADSTTTSALVAWLNRPHGTDEHALVAAAIEALGSLNAPESVPALTRLATAEDPGLSAAAIGALGRLKIDAAHAALLELLKHPQLEIRQRSLTALASTSGPSAVPELLAAWREPTLRADALLALCRTPDARALEAYLDGLASKNPELRGASHRAIATLAPALRPTIETRANQLPPEAIRELQSIYANDPAAKAGPIFRTKAADLSPESYLEYALTHPGDPQRGRSLFHDAQGLNCIGCHRVAGVGADVGPDLTNMGGQFGVRDLAESILWPSKVVREGYQPVIVELKGGEELVGLIKGESPTVITLRDSSGRLRQVPKSEITGRRQSELSLMPEGLQAGLSLAEFADLVAFASSCRSSAP